MSYSAETSDSFSYCLNAAEKTTTHQIRAAALIITRVLCFRSPRKGGKQKVQCILLLLYPARTQRLKIVLFQKGIHLNDASWTLVKSDHDQRVPRNLSV